MVNKQEERDSQTDIHKNYEEDVWPKKVKSIKYEAATIPLDL
jgi:hypothetical protein